MLTLNARPRGSLRTRWRPGDLPHAVRVALQALQFFEAAHCAAAFRDHSRDRHAYCLAVRAIQRPVVAQRVHKCRTQCIDCIAAPFSCPSIVSSRGPPICGDIAILVQEAPRKRRHRAIAPPADCNKPHSTAPEQPQFPAPPCSQPTAAAGPRITAAAGGVPLPCPSRGRAVPAWGMTLAGRPC
jgi:hypothetical protein